MIFIRYSTDVIDIIHSPEFLKYRALEYGDQRLYQFRKYPFKGIVKMIMEFTASSAISSEYRDFIVDCLENRKLTFNGSVIGEGFTDNNK